MEDFSRLFFFIGTPGSQARATKNAVMHVTFVSLDHHRLYCVADHVLKQLVPLPL